MTNWERGAYWYRVYRARIRLGLEHCRGCGTGRRKGLGHLTFDHIMPRSRGGTWGLANVTILCGLCNSKKADRFPDLSMRSLADEERAAPDEEKWSVVPGYLRECVELITSGTPHLAPNANTRQKALRRMAAKMECRYRVGAETTT